MNKKLLSLTLFAVFSITISVVAEEKKIGAKLSEIPAHAQKIVKEFDEKLENAQLLAQRAKMIVVELQNRAKSEYTKDAKSKIPKATQELATAELEFAVLEETINFLKNHLYAKYSKSLIDKITVPVRYVAHLIANNNKIALVLEVTGIAGFSYVIYKYFFNQNKDDDSL